MTTHRTSLPVDSKAFRFAPALNAGFPASNFWKVWAEGDEVYLSSRTPGGNQRFSIHRSGQVHYRLATKEKRDLAQVMRLSGPWAHAIELRFLLSRSSLPPLRPKEGLRGKSAFLIPVPDGAVFHANLLFGDVGISTDFPLPDEMQPGGQILWRTRLRNGRLAILVGRIFAQSEENREHIRYIREELRPTVNVPSLPSGGMQVETHSVHWSAHGGNVVLVTPMGAEAVRADDERESSIEERVPRRIGFDVECAELLIRAPDGKPVASLRIEGMRHTVEIFKGTQQRIAVGQLRLELLTSNLIVGSAFTSSPQKMPHILKIGGASPRDWAYAVSARFDGSAMTVRLAQLSTALRNANLKVDGLDDTEEITLAIPYETLEFNLTSDVPQVDSEFAGQLRLRDLR